MELEDTSTAQDKDGESKSIKRNVFSRDLGFTRLSSSSSFITP